MRVVKFSGNILTFSINSNKFRWFGRGGKVDMAGGNTKRQWHTSACSLFCFFLLFSVVDGLVLGCCVAGVSAVYIYIYKYTEMLCRLVYYIFVIFRSFRSSLAGGHAKKCIAIFRLDE